MFTLLSAFVVGAVLVWGTLTMAREIRAARRERFRDRTAQLLGQFTPGLVSVADDPRQLLIWQPLADTSRKLFPQEFAELDRTAGGTFPFSRELLQAAHARWTADWLEWELAHDAEFKLKAAAAESNLSASGGSPVMRAKLDAVEREKLGQYQRRYEEYVRVAKALQALTR